MQTVIAGMNRIRFLYNYQRFDAARLVDAAVDEATRRGRTTGAMVLADQQRKTRDAMVVSRQAATAALIEMQTQRAALTAETTRVEAATGPVQYIATTLRTDSETAVRWLVLLMVLCCDPAAIALTIAVAGAGHPAGHPTTKQYASETIEPWTLCP
jgi:hypothetical protein